MAPACWIGRLKADRPKFGPARRRLSAPKVKGETVRVLDRFPVRPRIRCSDAHPNLPPLNFEPSVAFLFQTARSLSLQTSASAAHRIVPGTPQPHSDGNARGDGVSARWLAGRRRGRRQAAREVLGIPKPVPHPRARFPQRPPLPPRPPPPCALPHRICLIPHGPVVPVSLNQHPHSPSPLPPI